MIVLTAMVSSSRRNKNTFEENSSRESIMERDESTVKVTSLKESTSMAQERRELSEQIS